MSVIVRQDTRDLLTRAIGPACHELRSPLAVVYGFAKMLESSGGLDEASARYVSQVVNGANRLDGLLDHVSKLGRIATGRLVPTLESVSVRSVVGDSTSTACNCARVTVDEGPDVHVRADATWLSEAVQGSLDALCFDEEMTITVSWTIAGDEVTITLTPGGDYPMIDVDPDKASLALAVARMRVAAMGGSLEGDDTRLVLLLPRAS